MIVQLILPSQIHFRKIEDSQFWYCWEDKGSSRVKILSRSANPWDKEVLALPHITYNNKGDGFEYPAQLQLKVYPLEDKVFKKGTLVREIMKGYFPHTLQDVALFAAFPMLPLGRKRVPHWLIYQIVGVRSET